MIRSLIHRDLRGRYKGSVLGFLWTFINPLLQLAVYTIVFSMILIRGIEQYWLFLFVALIPWIFFSSSILNSSSCIIYNKNLVTKIYFPREVLPIAIVSSCFINMLCSFIVLLILVIFFAEKINFFAWFFLPIIMLSEYILTLGISFALAAITVYIRDVEHIVRILIMSWQFLTPIMYSIDMVPDKLIRYYELNPMLSITCVYRDILYYAKIPDINMIFSSYLFSIIFLLIGFIIFNKLKVYFAEEL